jgi:hypothetical protein
MFNKIFRCLRLLTLISISVIGGGCATPNPDVILSSNKVKINVGKISVSDLSIPTEKGESGVWASGYIKLSDNSTNPPFSKFVFDTLSSNLIPTSENQMDILEVMLLNANIQMEMRISDSIAFVGIASALSNRDYLCTVVINLRLGSVNKRKNFESKMTYSRSWSDLDTVAKKELVETCVSSIVSDTANFANLFVITK